MVARLVRDQEVVGSTPATPTKNEVTKGCLVLLCRGRDLKPKRARALIKQSCELFLASGRAIYDCEVGGLQSNTRPVTPTKKKRTFVYQKFSFCLSIAKAMAYHHALACISSTQAYIINRRLHRFRNDDIQCSALMISATSCG